MDNLRFRFACFSAAYGAGIAGRISAKGPLMRTRAFSLIELLVSIAIITLLVGILIPTLSAARKRAQAAVCLSNMRQIGLAMLYYGQDNNDLISRASMTAQWGPPRQPFMVRPWGEALVPYLLPYKREGFSREDQDAAEIFGRLFRGVYRCPADVNHISEDWVYNADKLYVGHWSYGKNVILEYYGIYVPDYQDPSLFTGWSKFKLVPNPAATVLFGEIQANKIQGRTMADHFMVDDWYRNTGYVSIDTNRHGDASNYIYADGHAGKALFKDEWDPPRHIDNFTPNLAK